MLFRSYYIGQTITWQSASWAYHPFNANGLVAGTAGSDVGLSIDIPATGAAVQAFDDALTNNRLCQVLLYEFSTLLSQTLPQASQLLIGSYVGEVIGISGSFAELQISLGSSLAPVGAQVPPRKYSSILIGAPIQI